MKETKWAGVGVPALIIRGVGPYQLDGYSFEAAASLWQGALVKGELLSYTLGPEPLVVDPKDVVAIVTLLPAPVPSGSEQLKAALRQKKPH